MCPFSRRGRSFMANALARSAVRALRFTLPPGDSAPTLRCNRHPAPGLERQTRCTTNGRKTTGRAVPRAGTVFVIPRREPLTLALAYGHYDTSTICEERLA